MSKPPTSLQRLNAMIIAYKKAKYGPNQPGLEYNSMKCNSANSLTQCVIKFLQLKGHQAERINTQGRRIDQTRIVTDCLGFKRQIGSVKWVPGTGTRGSADISATVNGRSVKIEVKWKADRQSSDQKAYQANVEMAGGVYLIVRTLDDLLDWYETFAPCQ